MTLYFNGGTQPLVPEGRWGEGVIMPGESYETDAILGPPWTEDEEAAQALAASAALLGLREAGVGDTSDSAPDGGSGAQDASRGVSSEPPAGEGPPLRTLDNGDVVNEAGEVVGHIEVGNDTGGTA